MSLIQSADPICAIKKSGHRRELNKQKILVFVNQKTIYLG